MNMDSLDKDIACGPDELRERLWKIIRTAKYQQELCNSDGDIISAWYSPIVDADLAMLLVDKLVEAGVTFDVIATWKHRGDKNDFLWAECSNCGWRVENYKAVEIGVSSTDYIGIKYKRCPKCEAKMVLNIDGG